jgi:hypothetical protein
MSWQATSWVTEKSKHKGSALLVFLMIGNHCNSNGEESFPSIETLARECRIIARLIASGELQCAPDAGPRGTNVYSIPGVIADGFHERGARVRHSVPHGVGNEVPHDSGAVGNAGSPHGERNRRRMGNGKARRGERGGRRGEQACSPEVIKKERAVEVACAAPGGVCGDGPRNGQEPPGPPGALGADSPPRAPALPSAPSAPSVLASLRAGGAPAAGVASPRAGETARPENGGSTSSFFFHPKLAPVSGAEFKELRREFPNCAVEMFSLLAKMGSAAYNELPAEGRPTRLQFLREWLGPRARSARRAGACTEGEEREL